MFEKEAEEWVKENMDCCKTDNSANQSIPYFDEEERCCSKSAFKDGAEFGYNKANEWHYPLTLDKDGQPISDNPVAESYPIEILMYDFETGSKEVIKYDTSWAYYRKDGSSIRRNHIAWKEIVLPKEIE